MAKASPNLRGGCCTVLNQTRYPAQPDTKHHQLPPRELRRLAERLANAKSPRDISRLRESLTHGFYGI